MRYLLSILCLLLAIALRAQEGSLVAEYAVILKDGGWEWFPQTKKLPESQMNLPPQAPESDVDVVPSLDEQSFLNLLLLDKKTVSAVTFNTSFELVNSAIIPRSKEKGSVFDDFNEIAGSFSSNSITTLILSNGSNKKYGALQYDWKMKSFKHQTNILLEIGGKEEILDAHAMGNRLLLVTITQGTSTVKVHIFNDDLTVKSLTFDLGAYVFASQYRELFYSLIYSRAAEKIMISPVYNDTMHSLADAADRRKIYFTPDKIYITIDDRDVYTNLHTRIITLDLIKGDALVELVKIPTINCSEFGSNSFLFEDKLFQVVACDDELVVVAKKMGTFETIREFRTTKNDTISFKNTPIIQEGGRLEATKKKAHENTKRLLNMMGDNKAGAGICVNRLPSGNLEFTLGSFKELVTRIGGNMVPFAGAVSSFPFYYNAGSTSAYSFSITNERAIYVKGLLQPGTLMSTPGMATPNALERIAAQKLDKKIGAMVIWINGICYAGYYEKQKKLYRIERY